MDDLGSFFSSPLQEGLALALSYVSAGSNGAAIAAGAAALGMWNIAPLIPAYGASSSPMSTEDADLLDTILPEEVGGLALDAAFPQPEFDDSIWTLLEPASSESEESEEVASHTEGDGDAAPFESVVDLNLGGLTIEQCDRALSAEELASIFADPTLFQQGPIKMEQGAHASGYASEQATCTDYSNVDERDDSPEACDRLSKKKRRAEDDASNASEPEIKKTATQHRTYLAQLPGGLQKALRDTTYKIMTFTGRHPQHTLLGPEVSRGPRVVEYLRLLTAHFFLTANTGACNCEGGVDRCVAHNFVSRACQDCSVCRCGIHFPLTLPYKDICPCEECVGSLRVKPKKSETRTDAVRREFKRHLKRLRFPHENDKDCECKMLGMPQERCILSWFEDSLIGDA